MARRPRRMADRRCLACRPCTGAVTSPACRCPLRYRTWYRGACRYRQCCDQHDAPPVDLLRLDPTLPHALGFGRSGQGYFLDEEAEAGYSDSSAAQAARSIVPLLNLPDAAPDAQVTQAVAAALDVPAADLRLNALTAALAKPDRSHAALRRALVLWATEPEIVAPGQVPGSMACAFGIAGSNLDLLRLYVPRAMALISAFPNRAADFPDPARLIAVAESEATPDSDLPSHLRDDLREGLLALARSVQAALVGAAPPQSAAEPTRLVHRARRTA